MGFADRICEARNFDSRRFLPFLIDSLVCGWLRPDFAQRLLRWPHLFAMSKAGVALTGAMDTPAKRSSALEPVMRALFEDGVFSGWRDEAYPVATGFDAAPKLHIERAAALVFGIRTRGAHLNGYVGHGEDTHMWIARRAATKPVEPLMLDNLVGGGIGIGFTPRETILKECDEEAGITPELAQLATQQSAMLILQDIPAGAHWELLHTFDLELPFDFKPVNRDGEVAEFFLLPIAEVRRLVRDTTELTSDAAMVILDFLLRHNLTATSPAEQAALVSTMHDTASIEAW